MMDRRTFVCALGGGLFAMPIAAEAQRPAKVYRIGLLDYSAPDPGREAWWNAFRQQMRRKILAHLALGHSGQSPGPAPPGSGVAAS